MTILSLFWSHLKWIRKHLFVRPQTNLFTWHWFRFSRRYRMQNSKSTFFFWFDRRRCCWQHCLWAATYTHGKLHFLSKYNHRQSNPHQTNKSTSFQLMFKCWISNVYVRSEETLNRFDFYFFFLLCFNIVDFLVDFVNIRPDKAKYHFFDNSVVELKSTIIIFFLFSKT